MKKILSTTMATIFFLSSAAFAQDGAQCGRVLKSNAIVNKNEGLALVVDTTPDNRLIYKSCAVESTTSDSITIGKCVPVGSEYGYTKAEVDAAAKSLSKKRWLSASAKTLAVIALIPAGFYAGAQYGIHSSEVVDALYQGLNALFYGAIGAIVGPICGGLSIKKFLPSRFNFKQQGAELTKSTALANSNTITVIDTKVSDLIQSLTYALK